MLNPIMRQVMGIGDELAEGIGRADKEALGIFSSRLTSMLPGNATATVRGTSNRGNMNIVVNQANGKGTVGYHSVSGDDLHRQLMQNSEEYRASALEIGRSQRQARIDARSNAATDARFEAVNKSQQRLAREGSTVKYESEGYTGADGYVPGATTVSETTPAASTFQLQNRKGQGAPGYHDPGVFPDFREIGDVVVAKPGSTPMSPVQRAQIEGGSSYEATRATDKDRLTKAKPGGLDKAQRDAAYMQAVREGKTGYNGEQTKLDDINAQIDRAFDPPKPKSNKGSNQVSSKKAGYEGFQSGGLFMNFVERHGGAAMIGAGAGMMSEGEVSAGGAARGAMFGVMGGKAARMVTGSMKGGAVNALGKSVGSKVSGMGAEGGAANRAGQYLQETMEGFAGSKSQEAMRVATFAGAGLAGFSMGRDRNHSRGMNSGRGSRF